MRQIFKYMHLSDKLTKDAGAEHINHAPGALKVEAVDPKPWEYHMRKEAYDNSVASGRTPKKVSDTKGWGNHSRKDYSWLQKAPHEQYLKEVAGHGHNGAYPLEEIKVNGKYIHIDDDPHTGKYEDHPFDNHPIMRKFHVSNNSAEFKGDRFRKYLESVGDYNRSDHMDRYYDKHDKLRELDPDGYGLRGSKKSDAIHNPVEVPLAIEEFLAEKEARKKARRKTKD